MYLLLGMNKVLWLLNFRLFKSADRISESGLEYLNECCANLCSGYTKTKQETAAVLVYIFTTVMILLKLFWTSCIIATVRFSYYVSHFSCYKADDWLFEGTAVFWCWSQISVQDSCILFVMSEICRSYNQKCNEFNMLICCLLTNLIIQMANHCSFNCTT